MVQYIVIEIFTSIKSVNIQGVLQKADPQKNGWFYRNETCKNFFKNWKTNFLFFKIIHFIVSELLTHEWLAIKK